MTPRPYSSYAKITLSCVNLKDSEKIWQKMLMLIYLDIFESLKFSPKIIYVHFMWIVKYIPRLINFHGMQLKKPMYLSNINMT